LVSFDLALLLFVPSFWGMHELIMNDVLRPWFDLVYLDPPRSPACRLMGKVASDKCHKWVFKEPSECEPNISNYWQSSFDAVRTIIGCASSPSSFPFLQSLPPCFGVAARGGAYTSPQ
jgi:hypothetical protein